jgi:hypothetical protein
LRPFCVNSAQAFCPNAAIRWRGSNNLIVIVGHSPHEEPLLVLSPCGGDGRVVCP